MLHIDIIGVDTRSDDAIHPIRGRVLSGIVSNLTLLFTAPILALILGHRHVMLTFAVPCNPCNLMAMMFQAPVHMEPAGNPPKLKFLSR
jgi:hypothetical protein